VRIFRIDGRTLCAETYGQVKRVTHSKSLVKRQEEEACQGVQDKCCIFWRDIKGQMGDEEDPVPRFGLSLAFFLQFRLDHLLKAPQAPIVQAFAINENRRRTPHPRLPPVGHISDDQPLYRRVLQVFVELFQVKLECSSNLLHLGIVQGSLVGEELLVKLLEFALGIGGQGSSRCPSGKFVAGKGKVLDHHFNVLRVFLQHLLEQRLEPLTVGSLIVIKHRHGHRGIGRTVHR
jgi:hypothetical protein